MDNLNPPRNFVDKDRPDCRLSATSSPWLRHCKPLPWILLRRRRILTLLAATSRKWLSIGEGEYKGAVTTLQAVGKLNQIHFT